MMLVSTSLWGSFYNHATKLIPLGSPKNTVLFDSRKPASLQLRPDLGI